MHRMKIGLGAAGVLLVLTAVFYMAVTSRLKGAVTRDVEEKVARAQRVYQDISRLSGIDFANVAADRARRPSVVSVVDRADVIARRQAAFEECEVINAGLLKEGRKADIVAFLDSTGKLLARDLNPNADFGEDMRRKFPAVAQALKGAAVKDVWTLQDRMHEVAVAPVVKPDGTIVGALLIGYVLSNKKAQERRDQIGVEIAYFHGGKVHTSSFVSEGTGEGAKEDVAKTQALASVLFQGAGLADAALRKGGPTEVHHFAIEGKDYAVVATPFPGNYADRTSGVVLLASVFDGFGRASHAGTMVVFFGLLAMLAALAAAVMTARRFLRPLDQIELQVAEIINGNIDLQFKPVGPDFEGLSNSLNVMLARLLGREEPNEDAVEEEDDAEDNKWRSEQMVIEAGDGSAPPAAAAALGQENEASYYPRLFNEYVTALRAGGKPADGVAVQAFMAKLRLVEGGLRQKWSCKAVRFQIVARGPEIVFRAVRIS